MQFTSFYGYCIILQPLFHDQNKKDSNLQVAVENVLINTTTMQYFAPPIINTAVVNTFNKNTSAPLHHIRIFAKL